MPFQKKIISLLAYKLTRAEEIRASVTKNFEKQRFEIHNKRAI